MYVICRNHLELILISFLTVENVDNDNKIYILANLCDFCV
jgi:hypothetical protein